MFLAPQTKVLIESILIVFGVLLQYISVYNALFLLVHTYLSLVTSTSANSESPVLRVHVVNPGREN